MLKSLAITAICLLGISYSFAQEKDSVPASKQERQPNELMIKFAMLSILDTDGGLGFSGEYLFTRKRIGIQMEVQPLFFSVYSDNNNTRGFDKPVRALEIGSTHGIKLRPEVRYYTDGLRIGQRSSYHTSRRSNSQQGIKRRLQRRTYLAAAFLYKKVWRQNINEFEFSNGGTQSVRSQAEYTDMKRILGFEGKIGVVGPVWGKHWLADVYFGIGIRYKKFSYQNLPTGASEPRRGIEFFGPGDPGTYTERFPSFPIGIRLVYRL